MDFLVAALRVGTRSALFSFPISRPLKNPNHVRQTTIPLRGVVLLRTFSALVSARQPSRTCRRQVVPSPSTPTVPPRRTATSIRAGSTHAEAEVAASDELYRGLHFSPYNTLVNILWDEFASEVPEEAARAVALRLLALPVFRDVLAKYDLTDDFAATPEYESLYTELVGTVQILLEDGLQ